jgi:hypothetical protein
VTLGYRAFFNVAGPGDILHLVDEQTFAWLSHKRWRYEDLAEGSLVEVSPDARGIVLTENALDGSRTKRYRFIQSGNDGQWVTELTTHVERDGTNGWVWLEIDQPESARAGTPRLARMLVEALPVSDGRHPLTPGPMTAGVDDVDAIVDSVLDPSRQGLLFLAGSAARADIPLQQWATYVDGILRETVGLSSAYVLDAEATARFNQAVPPSHELREYAIRTYRPDVQFGEPLDGSRHRILSTQSIIRDNPHYLRRLLGNRAREVVISGTLPSAVRRLDRRLRDQLDSLLTEGSSETRTERLTDAAVTPSVEVTEKADGFGALLNSILLRVFGEGSVTDVALRNLGQLALDAKDAIAASRNVKQRLTTLENRVDAADETIRDLRRRLEDEQIESASAAAELAESDRQLRYFKSELASTGRGDIAWAVPAVSPIDIPPESFDELLQRVNELNYVEFTGDPDRARELDDHEVLGVWAGHCWRALLALNDYADQSGSGDFSGSVDTYLSNTPTGCHPFSTNRHAPFESSDVANNPKYRNPRTLPVPRGVARSGIAYMEAHFKIAKSATITPRMHYFDDTARSGKVYVGYIGRHLPSSMTN